MKKNDNYIEELRENLIGFIGLIKNQSQKMEYHDTLLNETHKQRVDESELPKISRFAKKHQQVVHQNVKSTSVKRK